MNKEVSVPNLLFRLQLNKIPNRINRVLIDPVRDFSFGDSF